MPKLPGINHQHAVRALEKVGFRVVRQGKHSVMSDGMRILPFPGTTLSMRSQWEVLYGMLG
jgi:predicted RNA binding protein YcfA (HicA-like mRNA interferase family)